MQHTVRHPSASNPPGTVLGYRRDGRPIHPIAGASPEGDPAPTPTPPAVPPVPAPQSPPPVPAAPPAAAGGEPQDVASLPAWAQKQLTDARADAARARTTAKETAAAEARAELLRQLSGGAAEPLTPEQLQQQLQQSKSTAEQATAQALAATVELSVYRTAQRLGANAEALLDSRGFCDKVDALDATDPAAFTTAVEQLVTTTLAAQPRYRAAAAGRSSIDAGTGGEPAVTLEAQIADATKRRDWGTVIALKRRAAAR
jgi:hypothetical protein